MTEHRAVEHLHQIGRERPNLARLIDRYRAMRGDPLPEWPDWCFLPMGYWLDIWTHPDVRRRVSGGDIINMSRIAAIGPWRYSQGIYRLHPEMLRALAESAPPKDLPVEVLLRLPEWSVYFETPGLTYFGAPLHGFFSHLEWDTKRHCVELRFLFDLDVGLIATPLHIEDGTVDGAIEQAVTAAAETARRNNLAMPVHPDGDLVAAIRQNIAAPVAALLYLCSEAPEIKGEREPLASPSRPREKRVKKGWKLFPPHRERVWLVGMEAGEKLQQEPYQGEFTGKRLRAHLRRGHWHGYWVGSAAKGTRRFEYRWLPPIVAGGLDHDRDELAVIGKE